MIDNYSDLQAAVANWLKRSDLTDDIKTFIQLAEAQFNRKIRTQDMETRSQATADGEYLGLPDDFLGLRAIRYLNSYNKPLKYLSPSELTRIKGYQDTGSPYAYTVEDGQIKLYPAPDATNTVDIEIEYLARIPSLSDSQTTNWLLDDNPDVYLFGTLVAAEPFLYNEERMPLWKSQLEAAINELAIAAGKARLGAGPLMPRVENVA